MSFAAADFTITDGDGDPLKEVRIETLPASAAGMLKLSGTAIGTGELPKTVAAADLGDLVFDPAAGFGGAAAFTFKVVDSFGAVAAAANTATVTVDGVAAGVRERGGERSGADAELRRGAGPDRAPVANVGCSGGATWRRRGCHHGEGERHRGDQPGGRLQSGGELRWRATRRGVRR